MNRAKRDLRVYVDDILAAISKIENYVSDGREAFLQGEMKQDAVVRQLAIIGEAVAKLPRSVLAKYPDIPWKKIVGMRNIIIHEYSDTHIPTVWLTVERDLPPLKSAAASILDRKIA